MMILVAKVVVRNHRKGGDHADHNNVQNRWNAEECAHFLKCLGVGERAKKNE